MPRVGDNIYLRKDGRWEARFAIAKDINGEKKYRSVYGETREEALENRLVSMLKLEEDFKRTHRFVGDLPNQPSPLTKVYSCEKWFILFLVAERQTKSERTLEKYRMLLASFILPAFGEMPISMITHETIKEMTEDMFADNRGKKLAHEAAWLVNRGMAKAVREGLLRYNPYTYIARPNQKEFFTYFLKEGVLTGVPESDSYQLKAALCLMQETRLQLSKILSLQWKDIDFDQRLILLNKNTYQDVAIEPVTKPDLSELPLTEFTYQILKELKTAATGKFVFKKDNNLWTERNISHTYFEMDSRNR
ncbi:tyrosine-type recombinase/integrase [Enterococcus sp. AZ072]|uniref:tyrosine-type recombinase/integrase n=1 Tax=unclassified Enterococcus TaxID=2608891 RepID=UPI003D27B631